MAERDDVKELLGAYVLGHLEGDDLARVELALAQDEALRREADELRAVADLLPLVDADEVATDDGVSEPPPGLADAVLAELDGEQPGSGDVRPGLDDARRGSDEGSDVEVARPRRGADEARPRRDDLAARRRAVPRGPDRQPGRVRQLLPAAAALLVLVVGAVVVLQDDEEEPGLGVEEPIAFDVQQDPIEVDASLVPHTWGTEVFLTMEGLADGEVYLVDLEADDGELVSAGTFLGDADLEVVCVMNGALLREDVAAVVITTEDGAPVMRAELDDVDYRSV
jgi:hypothetical protein